MGGQLAQNATHCSTHSTKVRLLGTTALVASLTLFAAPAQAGCAFSGATITCTGDLATGVSYVDTTSYNTLNILSVTGAIQPAAGTPGVLFKPRRPDGGNGGCHNYLVYTDCWGGDDGGAGQTITMDVQSAQVITANANGVVGISRGGNGGDGGGGWAAFYVEGGSGGHGGVGGDVTISTSGSIATTGDYANGIVGLSIGGYGGDGGNAYGAGSDGGSGGAAAGGGNVTITSSSTITTNGLKSNGIVAQSNGGYGGAGGHAGGIWSDSGGGGRAAPGGVVSVTNTGDITTGGDYSAGIFAQSVGGFGGNGGWSGGLVAFGSSGGSAGDGGTVTVANSATIITHGIESYAIFAQSAGGGGGDGGSAGGLVALGAEGSVGGAGSAVTVTNNGAGSLTTYGAGAAGIFAQSIGGGGGNGGNSIGLAAIGGKGSTTSPGGAVTVTNSQAITTNGASAQAIFAQSIGGGGGNGGFSAGVISIGGSGGGGGDGGTVSVSNSGALTTKGDDASALFAQSVGGGGGNGGMAVAAGYAFSFAMGGNGAAGGAGSSVAINELLDLSTGATSTISTAGDRSHGIQAQSIGGGGGNGGLAVAVSLGETWAASVALGGKGGGGGASSTVLLNERGTITTAGDQSYGILAQSIGGGGGNGGGAISGAVSTGYSIAFSMGGKGGSGGDSDAVTVHARGSISTSGDESYAVLAQSIGGGGGNGGYAISLAGSTGPLALSLGLGGKGDHGGNAGNVTVDINSVSSSNKTITTTGAGAIGILAQSIGGGGGNGGFSAAASASAIALDLSLAGGGAGGGIGGDVLVGNFDNVVTYGNNASAIFAQSVGGGGGNGGLSVGVGGGVVSGSVAVGGAGAMGGAGGLVSLINEGNIATYGDLSYGIFTQSVGGGGGNGGFALSGALGFQIEDIPGGALAISVGGKGGSGQVSSNVLLNNSGFIGTGGLGSHAIFAQSIGGGGGSGGFAGSIALTIGSGASFGVAVGGNGSTGGNAGKVDVTSVTGGLVTAANGADGIMAQSIGGGGGDGGFAFSGALGFGGDFNLNLSVAIGGKGGTGGTGNEVTVYSSSAITTHGDQALGIVAQSVGGGGGSGGWAISGTIGLAESTGGAAVTVGGNGGSGGTAGHVSVTSAAAINTYGYESFGILAQSIGGGGGNGGLALTAQLSGATQDSATLGAAVGGKGGSGNTAGKVEVLNQAGITTRGFGAHAIEAQSIGGGGGNGGLAALAQLSMAGAGSEETPSMTVNMGVTIGGNGGSGGVAGEVDVTNQSAIDVTGLSAIGIFAQSVGGGGGNGGGALNAVGVITDSTVGENRAVNVDVAIGGKGGAGNDSGLVDVENSGSIVTRGGSGYGIFAQSIGGGGGIGGRANTIAMMVTPSCTLPIVCSSPEAVGNNWQLGVTVGGSGGSAGNGNTVIVHNTGSITTSGDTSDGIVAQSVGGGGGMGGNGAIGSDGVLPFPGELALIPVGAVKIYQNIQVAVGGNGGSAGNGGTVTVDNGGSITTRGATSNGIFAQSIGGGGGVGGTGVIGATGILGIGGKGNSGGNGGAVTVTTRNASVIETFGAGSDGIFAQSVGGGGGVAGNVNRALANPMTIPGVGWTIPSINLGIGLAVGQGGGDGGDGGAVAVSLLNTSQVITHGDGVMGIFAQSVGGGGGLLGGLGDTLTINNVTYAQVMGFHAGSNGDAGNGGAVTVNVAGAVRMSGNKSIGVLAQSAGGKGTGGAVNVTVSGSVLAAELLASEDGTAAAPTRGLGGTAILAQSVGDTANGAITVNIANASAVVRGGRSGNVTECALYFLSSCPTALQITRREVGVGIWLIDGTTNTIVNRGLVTTADGVNDGWAILATDSGPNVILPLFHTQTGGDDTVQNYGTVTGSFNLGRGINTFINETGGIFNSGKYASVGTTAGAANLLQNDGTIRPGGSNNVFVTQVTGNLKQSAGGHYGVDLDLYQTDVSGVAIPGKTADRIDVTGTGTAGGTATLSGSVDVGIMHPGSALAGSHTVTIMHADNALVASGLALATPASVVATYHLTYPDTRTLNLDYAIDFSPDGLNLNPNQTALGDYINRITLTQPRVGTPGATPDTPMTPLLTALFNLPDGASYKAALNELIPEILTANSIATEFSSLQFADSLMSCHKADGESRYIAEGSCVWLKGSTRGYHSAASSSYGFDRENDSSIAIGIQQQVAPNLQFGFAMGYENGTETVGNADHAGGKRVQFGGSLKAEIENTLLAMSVSGGFGDYKVARHIAFTGFTADAAGKQSSGFVAVHGRGVYVFDFDQYYVKPKVDMGLTYLSYSPYTETGTASAILTAPAQHHAWVTAQPALEFGMQYMLPDEMALRPYVSLGLLASLNGGAADISAALAGAPPAAGTFKIKGNMPSLMFDSTVGVEFISAQGFAVQLGGSAQTNGPVTGETGWLKLSLRT